MDVTDGDSGDAVFRMKPAAAIEVLAPQFVDGQRLLAHARQVLATLPADAPVDVVTEVRQRVDDLVTLWDSQQGPNLAACFRLALEVLDTYGPEGADVEVSPMLPSGTTSTSCGSGSSAAPKTAGAPSESAL